MALDADTSLTQPPVLPAQDDENAGVQTYALGDAAAPQTTQLQADTASAPSAVQGNMNGPADSSVAANMPASQEQPVAAQRSPDTATDSSPATAATPTTECRFVGLDGSPISGLQYRLEADGNVEIGTTDDMGSASPVTTFAAGSNCAVYVKRDDGTFKQITAFSIPEADTTVTLMSPSMLLEGETQQHGGSPDETYKEPPAPENQGSDSEVHPAYSAEHEASSDGAAPSASQDATTTAKTPAVDTTTTPAQSAPTANTPPPAASAPQPKPAPPAPAPAKKAAPPAAIKGSTGKAPTLTTVATNRDAVGHPQAQPEESFTDWAGRKVNGAWHFIEDWLGVTTNPVAGKTVPGVKPPAGAAALSPAVLSPADAAKKLATIAEEQTAYSMPSSSTVVNLKQISDGTIKYGTKKTKQSKGQCYMYVKIALWKANAIKFVKGKDGKFAGGGGSYAKVAGAFLKSQGYEDVTAELPDARWAWPGDVIVYHVKGDTETADGHGQPGHIDIRTYHYYVSDFKRNYLCMSGPNADGTRHFYEVSGIYRKHGLSDPLPIARMRAFLKILRSREAKTFFLLGDDKTYHASQGVYTLQGGIKDFSTYPPGASHQGAYQMTKSVWTAGQLLEQGALPNDFSPRTQDRFAIFLMEGRPGRLDPKTGEPRLSALGYVRLGDIDNAVAQLRAEWACLPGTSQDQGYTMAQLKADFDKYVKEYNK
ncbi:flagellar hook-length control protein FliK [Paraburkholderia fungorum]|uniref:flagellar hook-length control protein FliK n=2 Tax=Bacteria TaxID=2 RepID=UPI000AD32E31|nr:flagellar hook-length control protein FliK [Paraburkholderia fungorum]